ncbi:hypothetical protein AQ490_26825 [Wenjunlia vitaminophila]|uniref:DUF2617 family protein n=1 Tax=Wenjunlia vitaminophila TaxID=76728 RepID=A0A0T6LQK5_WENVI|nr:DUF2617 family protein [Wenjunlia vitaminophila]KRV48076.1 hypothetical protein AQ490_26825 [Wenjunlia vitaminophila]
MLTTLHTPYADTRAGDLAWCLGQEPLPALAAVDLGVDGGEVQMRLLGASHQVLLESERGRCSETVACLPGRSVPLPVGVAERVDDWEYEFAARTESLPAASFAGRAQELLDLVAEHPHGLAGTFPGDPNAFTAMLVQTTDRGVCWRTWHAYPQEHRLVVTRSRLVLATERGRGRPVRRRPRREHSMAPRPSVRTLHPCE